MIEQETDPPPRPTPADLLRDDAEIDSAVAIAMAFATTADAAPATTPGANGAAAIGDIDSFVQTANGVRQRLLDSGMFDADFYEADNPDVVASGMDPLDHYIEYGAREDRDPSPRFETTSYLASYPDAAGRNALLHYLDVRDRLLDSRLFDAEFYTTDNPDVAASGTDPIEHYIIYGAREDRDPSPRFKTESYRASYPDAVGGNVLSHYLNLRDRLRGSGLFDAEFYITDNPDVAASGTGPLEHYIIHGAREGRDPSARFDTKWYLAGYPDAAGGNALLHYLNMRDHLLTSGLFDADFYRADNPDVIASAADPLDHYIIYGAREGRDPRPSTAAEILAQTPSRVRQRLLDSGMFDADFYLARNPDVAAAGIDPLDHYIEHGAREGWDPSAGFETRSYLASHPDAAGGNALLHYLNVHRRLLDSGLFDGDFYTTRNPDVVASGRDPLEHYIIYGVREDRDPNARFDTRLYRESYPDAVGGNPLLHLLNVRDRLLDSGLFDADFYKARNPDVVASGADPLDHYIGYGAREGRDPSPRFDAASYLEGHPFVAGGNPLLHHLNHLEARERLLASGLFDAEFYQMNNPDVLASGGDPLDHYIYNGARESRDPSRSFDTRAYRAAFPAAANENALLHFLAVGSKDGRSRQALRGRSFAPQSRAISWAEWQALADRIGELPRREPQIDVIVPIYRGLNDTANCLYSVVSSRLVSQTAIEVVAIDDCSPELELGDFLDRLAALGLLSTVQNEKRLGFLATANVGISRHPGRDVVLLNPDTEVYGDWIDRLHNASKAAARIGTVIPFSNNGTISNYPWFQRDFPFEFDMPFREIDSLAGEVNRGRVADIPAAVGFCTLIRRECLNEVGLFDVESFRQGHEGESDFYCRSIDKGWRNVLAGDVFVRHLGGRSFGGVLRGHQQQATPAFERLYPFYSKKFDTFTSRDPLKPLRRRLDVARLRRAGDRAVIMISHRFGGGAERHVLDLCGLLESAGIAGYVLQPLRNGSLAEIVHPRIREVPNLGYIDLKHGLQEAARLFRDLGVFHMHIHTLHGYTQEVFYFLPALCGALGIAYDFTFHDYLSICPRIEMIDESGVFCDKGSLVDCEACIRQNKSPYGDVGVGLWRTRYERLFRGARQLFTPDDDGSLRMQRLMPDLKITVRAHPEVVPAVRGRPLTRGAGEPLRVALIGSITPPKGALQLKLCAEDAIHRHLPITYTVFGRVEDVDVANLSNVEVTGPYRPEALQALLAGRPCHLAFIPTVSPESYSYVLSEALFAGLFPVAFDLGAQARRIRDYGWGLVLPLGLVHEPARVNDALLNCEVPNMPDDLPVTEARSYEDVLGVYYQLEEVRQDGR